MKVPVDEENKMQEEKELQEEKTVSTLNSEQKIL